MKLIDVIRKPFPYRRYNVTLALIIVNVGIFLITLLFRNLVPYLALSNIGVMKFGYVYQIFTYMFVHDTSNFTHIFFNMFNLYMFGMILEDRLGSIEFLIYYLFCGLGAGVAILFLSDPMVLTLGASGAIFGLLLAFPALFPEAQVLLFFAIPMKAPLASLVCLLISFIPFWGHVSYLGHLAGLIFGFIYLVIRLNVNPITVFFRRNRPRF